MNVPATESDRGGATFVWQQGDPSMEGSIRAPRTTAVDLVRLCKPRITVMVIVTALGGMWLAVRMAGARLGWFDALAALAGITLVVSSANALNMYLERDADGLMTRTQTRPLPAGRMAPRVALLFGLALGVASLPVLTCVNLLTAALAGVSLVLYVAVYTPLKRVTPWALMIGAVPGAAPPLLGWTAATGRLDAVGLGLFAVLFFWQLPHFLAIATFRRDEYARAGIRVFPAVVGDRLTRWGAIAFTLALVASSLLLVALGLDGTLYVVLSVVLGALFLAACMRGLVGTKLDAAGSSSLVWARSVFAVSLVYLPLLVAAMMVSA
jgi:protoheme IX farnesyltransferase